MAEVRFCADEHIPKAVIGGLRQRGVDVLTVVDAGLIGATDITHLRRARDDGRVVISQDDDFLRLAAGGEPHVGIVYAPQHTSVSALTHGLMLICRVLDAEEMVDHIEFL
jgi:predicted nuclease of predicted toxin-antitoxin system